MKPFRRSLLSLLFVLGLVAGCSTDDAGGGGLLDTDDPGGGNSQLVLTIEGPNGASSGQVSVEAGELAKGFVATLTTASGNPVDDRFIALTPEQGFVNAPPSRANSGGANTGSDGELEFDYQAPETLSSQTTIELVASVEADGDTLEEVFEIELVRASAPVLTLSGPRNVAPGVANSGYRVTATKASGAQIAEACVSLKTSAGTISPGAETTCDESGLNGWLTDSVGVQTFSLTPPANISSDTTVTLSAEATIGGARGTATYPVNVLADTFQFTAPSSNASVVVGIQNKERLRFQWTRDADTPSGAEGVTGTVALSSDNNNVLFVINNGVTGARTLSATTNGNASGEFTQAIYVYSNASGQATITAEDSSTAQTATLLLNFVDGPTQINLDATPLQVEPSPSAARFSNLDVTVLNQAGQPIAGIEVEFQLLQAAGSSVNERVFPQVQVTNSSGQASSRYEAGPSEGTAQVRVRAENGALSNIRAITVAADEE